jgi:arylsulfatase A-like enzyme/Flp pilus assembly protein TadD
LKLKGRKQFNYVLITVDTLRADRIGCYGFPEIETPTMDMFARRGVKFGRCIAQTPLTLPSHTSLLSGTHPTFNGVRDNGGFLVPQDLVMLAELFKDSGYSTSAFVAAYVLDSKWGIDQGFDHYFDRFDLSKYKTVSLGNVQRRGDEVIDEALSWLEKNSQNSFFAWIHLYDPHTPYDPPSPFREKYPGRPYLGEIAYTDAQLGRLWDYLEDKGLVEDTILIFASDHGESLGEHGEQTHGFFIYQEGIHVPLIFVTPVEKLKGLNRNNIVSLVDVMPTILEMAEIPIPGQVQGESLLPLFLNGEEKRGNFAYAETFYPRYHYGWSELTSIQEGRYKLIVAPELELYDLQKDPMERVNLASREPEITRRLMRIVEQFQAETSMGSFEVDYRNLDEEARQKLAALGYIGNFTDPEILKGKRLGDPKEKIVVFNQLSAARELILDEEYEDAVAMIQSILEKEPSIVDAYFTLGNLFLRQHDFASALDTFKKVLEIKPGDVFIINSIANAHIGLGEIDEAERFLLSLIDTIPPDSQIYLFLGNIKNLKGEHEEAIRYYEECIKHNPSSASAYNALGGILVVQGNLDEAEPYLQKALESNSKLRRLHYNFALLFEGRGDFIRAADEYKQEIENNPEDFKSSFNLSRIYRNSGDVTEEEKYLRMTMEKNPDFPLSYFYLARIYLNRGEQYEEAIYLAQKGIELKPDKKDLPLGYFLLADLYNRLGDQGKANENFRKGKALAQTIDR